MNCLKSHYKKEIRYPDLNDFNELMRVYGITIRQAFENEGVGYLEDEIVDEINGKKKNLMAYFKGNSNKSIYLIKVINDQIVATISFGPIGKETLEFVPLDFPSEGELGGLYVLPEFQNQGIGRQLISEMINCMKEKNIDFFSLDSGYKMAQLKWLKKFGEPYKIVKEYWGEDTDHMIWLKRTNDF